LKMTASLRKMAQFPAQLGLFLLGIGRFFLLIVDDLFVFGGLGIVVWTDFRVNELFGWYSLGVVLIGLGVMIGRRPVRRGK
jgi:hypothetical protein